jgi:acetolactate synthase I/II/III large subunit
LGILVENPEQLKGAIAQMLAHDGPVLMDVLVRKDENCYPMVAPGKGNADMVGLPQHKQLERATELVACGNCNTQNEQTHRFCNECGHKL